MRLVRAFSRDSFRISTLCMKTASRSDARHLRMSRSDCSTSRSAVFAVAISRSTRFPHKRRGSVESQLCTKRLPHAIFAQIRRISLRKGKGLLEAYLAEISQRREEAVCGDDAEKGESVNHAKAATPEMLPLVNLTTSQPYCIQVSYTTPSQITFSRRTAL